MNTILNLILIQIICCEVVDLSGFIDTLKGWLSLLLTKGKIRKTDYDLKPFSCSRCCTWWCCLFYLIFTKEISLFFIAVSLLLSGLALVTTHFLELVRDFIDYIIIKLGRKL